MCVSLVIPALYRVPWVSLQCLPHFPDSLHISLQTQMAYCSEEFHTPGYVRTKAQLRHQESPTSASKKPIPPSLTYAMLGGILVHTSAGVPGTALHASCSRRGERPIWTPLGMHDDNYSPVFAVPVVNGRWWWPLRKIPIDQPTWCATSSL
jgi:hypothetical protein